LDTGGVCIQVSKCRFHGKKRTTVLLFHSRNPRLLYSLRTAFHSTPYPIPSSLTPKALVVRPAATVPSRYVSSANQPHVRLSPSTRVTSTLRPKAAAIDGRVESVDFEAFGDAVPLEVLCVGERIIGEIFLGLWLCWLRYCMIRSSCEACVFTCSVFLHGESKTSLHSFTTYLQHQIQLCMPFITH
jgi:hypothetical protein